VSSVLLDHNLSFSECVKKLSVEQLVAHLAAFNNVIGHSVMAMITSAKNSAWPLDVEIKDLKHAGLPSSSIVRMKLFTIDHRLVLSTLGSLSASDSAKVRAAIQKLLDDHSEK
jgi:mRNA interferase MazF